MLMADVMVVVDSKNPDGNTLDDVVQGLADLGAVIHVVDRQSHTIEATLASHEIPVVIAMCGVSYVRVIFQYQSAQESLAAEGGEI